MTSSYAGGPARRGMTALVHAPYEIRPGRFTLASHRQHGVMSMIYWFWCRKVGRALELDPLPCLRYTHAMIPSTASSCNVNQVSDFHAARALADWSVPYIR